MRVSYIFTAIPQRGCVSFCCQTGETSYSSLVNFEVNLSEVNCIITDHKLHFREKQKKIERGGQLKVKTHIYSIETTNEPFDTVKGHGYTFKV
jgi:hypothetical protein